MTDKLIQKNIFSKGFGSIAKLVMQDTRLTIEAKAIYAYICSFAGGGNTAFPSVGKIINDLKISENRFYSHMKLLKQYGYIKTTKIRDKKTNRPLRNIYEIVYSPCTDSTDMSDTGMSDTGMSDTGMSDTGMSDTGTNNNSINNNSINNNSINNNSSSRIATTTNSELEDICNMYKREITNRIDCSPYEIQTFEDLLKEHNADEITQAIEIAVKRNKRSLGYIEGILKNKNKEGEKVAKYNRDTKQEIDWSKFD